MGNLKIGLGLLPGLCILVLFAFGEKPNTDPANLNLPPLPTESYPFVHWDANKLDGNTKALYSLWGKLDSLRQMPSGTRRVVSILHLGDSHIQGGILTDQIRAELQTTFGNAGRGLIIPFKIIGTNSSSDYSISSQNHWVAAKCTQSLADDIQLGVGGMVIETAEPQISFDIQTRPNDLFSKITVFHHPHAPLIQETEPFSTGIECHNSEDPYTSCCYLNAAYDSVRLTAAVVDPRFTLPAFYGFALENNTSGILYHAVGINGAAVEHYNRYPNIIVQSHALQPDLIIISLGTNEAFGRNFSESYFIEQLRMLLGQIRAVHGEVPVLLTTPMECCRKRTSRGRTIWHPNPNLQIAHDAIIAFASEQQLPYWDFYTIAGAEKSNGQWAQAHLLQKDRVHPTATGYKLQADLLYTALIQDFWQYTMHSTQTPHEDPWLSTTP